MEGYGRVTNGRDGRKWRCAPLASALTHLDIHPEGLDGCSSFMVIIYSSAFVIHTHVPLVLGLTLAHAPTCYLIEFPPPGVSTLPFPWA
jgi:hypothetical protein